MSKVSPFFVPFKELNKSESTMMATTMKITQKIGDDEVGLMLPEFGSIICTNEGGKNCYASLGPIQVDFVRICKADKLPDPKSNETQGKLTHDPTLMIVNSGKARLTTWFIQDNEINMGFTNFATEICGKSKKYKSLPRNSCLLIIISRNAFPIILFNLVALSTILFKISSVINKIRAFLRWLMKFASICI
ncbi:hypothetical protein EGR_10016 [Echinococcus granulosus]|uniref:Uncharacterized protein n=1 Tax=Echinococcus granulosus TaxID=6210 RepID=W6U253_ECHGR|nr:hypothetical protein EGR_10016 [Echinococcus granulosus]EUB55133.1 hypothetical protein EGR_10016 [Echinococcus granulosus]